MAVFAMKYYFTIIYKKKVDARWLYFWARWLGFLSQMAQEVYGCRLPSVRWCKK